MRLEVGLVVDPFDLTVSFHEDRCIVEAFLQQLSKPEDDCRIGPSRHFHHTLNPLTVGDLLGDRCEPLLRPIIFRDRISIQEALRACREPR